MKDRYCYLSSCKDNKIKTQNQINQKLATQKYFPERQTYKEKGKSSFNWEIELENQMRKQLRNMLSI